MEAASGSLTLAGTVAGTGTLEIGLSTQLILQAGSGAGQTVDFLSGAGGLQLGTPLDFLGAISGFGVLDQIDLLNTATNELKYSGGVLTVTEAGLTVASLHFDGSYTKANCALANDGHGGVLLTFK